MIKPKLTLFKMQMKRKFIHAMKPTESCLGITPKTLKASNIRLFLNKFITPMVDAKMLLIAQIQQPISPSSFIRRDDTFKLDTPADNGLKRIFSTTVGGSSAIRDDFSIDLPILFENIKDYRLPQCTSPSSTINTTSVEITFINFNFPRKDEDCLQ